MIEINESFMRMALHESMKALPMCLPNPPVGAVITHNNNVVGKGFTQRYGGKHAEVIAIENILKVPLNECEIYITLEPCSFYGKTPPCVEKIIEHDFRKVFIGIIDPHSKNNGKSVSMLRAKGIDVNVGLLKDEIEKFIEKYLWSEE
ncbi:bifunctional diaminohydroxyphosphoribosylaminopyrimidine deaminase/5-amino-6-(5-phosphoribosylamino)uracil reductase RibD [Photorhabdus akhurstii]|uniref:bifunctional diaminohydroxyphosphoribosylaminopyrimidine deaminase/5-amino-6-(5-phosphoribosylamino)uracil reductase RibD n=1 Tax=Photorhabdus akhurstii TaxID=171438 RepID=UPI003703B776